MCHRASVCELPHERDGALREITKTQHAAPVGPSTSLGLRRTSSVPVALLAVRVPENVPDSPVETGVVQGHSRRT